MVELRTATPEDWKVIQKIAYNTWPHTFGTVMPKEQIDYMLALIYNQESIQNQMINRNHQFVLALKDNQPVGFTSYECNYSNTSQLMVHKIYLQPECQGSGIGRKILDHLTEVAKHNNNKILRLKVFHKNDKAIGFYEKCGFSFAGTETTDIGNGYLILDNVMTKEVK